MTTAARTRDAYFADAAQSRFGTCDGCGRDRDHDERPLYVARARNARKFLCFDCATQPTRRRRSATTKTKPPAAAAAAQRFEMLPLTKLKPAPDNPRGDVGDVTEMAASMGELGVLEPFVTVQQNGHYLIVAGHRRYAAAKLAGLAEVPAIVRDLTDEQRVQAMLIENLQRTDLTPLEEARAYQRLVDEFGVNQRALAAKVGRSQGHLSKRLSLLALPKDAMAALDSGGITIEEAQELARIKDTKTAARVYKMRGQVYGGLKRAVQDELEAIKKRDLVQAEIDAREKIGQRAIAMKEERHGWTLPAGIVRIAKNPDSWSDALQVDPISHATEPCHAVAIGATYDGKIRTELVCTDRKRHPKAKTGRERGSSRSSTSQSREAIEHRELQKLRDGRRQIAATVAAQKLSTELHGELLLRTLIRSAHTEVLKVACRMVGCEPENGNYRDYGKALVSYAGSARARARVELAIAFATSEEQLSVWYDWSDENPYFDLLELHGYEISAVERKKLKRPGTKTA